MELYGRVRRAVIVEGKSQRAVVETFAVPEVAAGIADALRLGRVSFDAVKHLVLCRIERRPPRLDLLQYPHLPLPEVASTQAADYMSLLEVGR